MRYVIGDTHFGHENIIEYCSRPFNSAKEMNRKLVNWWNDEVDEDDTVIHLGDVRHHPDLHNAAWWLDRLNGDILLVRGNHDGGAGQNFPFHTAESLTIQHGRYSFFVEHQPVRAGPWQIHGHSHNNDLTTYPFIHHGSQRVNVSADVIGYRPLAMDDLVRYLDKNEDYTTLEEVGHYE